MTTRLISRLVSGAHTVEVRYASDWREYTVTLAGNPASRYYTDDKHDAIETAAAMLERATAPDPAAIVTESALAILIPRRNHPAALREQTRFEISRAVGALRLLRCTSEFRAA